MNKNHLLRFVACILWGYTTQVAADTPKKIVGLVPVRNEAVYIDQCLKALACCTDAIVVLDDASTDNTVAVVESLKKECSIERFIKKSVWHRDEPGDRSKLLHAGREIGGTHFVVLDADEMLTAPCMKNNLLRKKILELEPGDCIELSWIRLWKSLYEFRNPVARKIFIFCDDSTSDYYQSRFIHVSREPTNLKKGNVIHLKPIATYGVLHFQSVSWRNMQVRQAWYRCLEHIRNPQISPEKINHFYDNSEREPEGTLLSCPQSWFTYDFFNAAAYEAPEQWREQEICNWFNHYGRDFFADLNIWNIDWGTGLTDKN